MQESVCKCSSLRKREWLYKLNFSNFIPVFLVAIVPYSLVRDFETILIMKFTQSKLFNNIRLMPNKMLVSWILTSIIFSSIKTPQTKKKKPLKLNPGTLILNSGVITLDNYFMMLHDFKELIYTWTLFPDKLYPKGLISLPDSMLMKYIL